MHSYSVCTFEDCLVSMTCDIQCRERWGRNTTRRSGRVVYIMGEMEGRSPRSTVWSMDAWMTVTSSTAQFLFVASPLVRKSSAATGVALSPQFSTRVHKSPRMSSASMFFPYVLLHGTHPHARVDGSGGHRLTVLTPNPSVLCSVAQIHLWHDHAICPSFNKSSAVV